MLRIGIVLFCIFLWFLFDKFFDLKHFSLKWRLLIIALLILLVFPYQYSKEVGGKIVRSKIYLSYVEQHEKIPLIERYNPIMTIYKDIQKDERIGLRFAIVQGNMKIPRISKIAIKFPETAYVKPELGWEKTNTEGNEYSLGFSSNTLAKGKYWDLPTFEVMFRETEYMDFEYSIVGDHMDDIKRRFKIATIEKRPDTFRSYKKPKDMSSATPDYIIIKPSKKIDSDLEEPEDPDVNLLADGYDWFFNYTRRQKRLLVSAIYKYFEVDTEKHSVMDGAKIINAFYYSAISKNPVAYKDMTDEEKVMVMEDGEKFFSVKCLQLIKEMLEKEI
jgi:hypothetical protein